MSLPLARRVLSGMRPTGRLHLGHYHGVLKNWLALQRDYTCYFFVADWHALTTDYAAPQGIAAATFDMAIDWLAVGIDPERAILFVQSQVPEHAELHLLLSMITPLPWLERVPSYKDQQEKLTDKDLGTYGFLGYPLLQSADILIYQADYVPVGEDQVAHVELTREVARRFNHLYGRAEGWADEVKQALAALPDRPGFLARRRRHLEHGDAAARAEALAMIEAGVTGRPRSVLLGHLDDSGRHILSEPQPLLTAAAKMPGLDGQKMSKSYRNTIALADTRQEIDRKLRTMPTDPARARRTDPGDPAKCPVWGFHQVYSDAETRTTVDQGCRSAAIGCVDCKRIVIQAIQNELEPMQARAAVWSARPHEVRDLLAAGTARARAAARVTLAEVRAAMGLDYP